MPSAFVLLRCIGKAAVKHVVKAAVKNVVNLFSFGVGGDIVVDAWESWQKETREEQRAAEVQAVARLTAAELRAEVACIVREEAAALMAAQRDSVARYLRLVPATIRRSLRRPSDPSGTTTAAGAVFRKPEDLLPLLPDALPRFKAGDRPVGIGDWELVELLGVGGFGEVWKARNPHFDGVAPVALKFCLDPAARDHLLKHEAAVLNHVMRQGKHEGIVPLLHTYLNGDPPCLAYEYIDGGDLAGLIQERRGGFPAEQAARWIKGLAEIVGFAHRLSPPIVHRDLKPANILLKWRPDGKLTPRITDFGIGGLAIQEAVVQTRRGTKNGEFLATAVRGACTPLYASPQQMRGDKPDPRDDVYALGVIWYQLLTGDLTKGRPGGDAWRKRLAERGMTPALLALLASSYEDERKDRPANALVLAEKLDGLLRPSLSAARVEPIPEVIPVVEAPPVNKPRTAPQPKSERPPTPERVRTPVVGERKKETQGPGGGPRWSWGCGLLLACSLAGVALIIGFALMKRSNVTADSLGMKFAWCPPGTFQMGSPPGVGAKNETPQHKVTLTKGFYLGIHEVTQAQWKAVMGNNPSHFKGDNLPVENVTWKECQEFCTKLGQRVGKRYRLPTEAEWEYACRAGSTTAYFFGDDPKQLDEYAWYGANAEHKTHEVGTRKPNAWGLYDMSGNVWEWCQDGYGLYPSGDLTDPQDSNNEDARVVRGGSWNNNAESCRAAYRRGRAPGLRDNRIGLRVCFRLH